jgi:hypothetical protein
MAVHPAADMSWGAAHELDRTAKILIDAGLAVDPHDAHRYLETLVLQVAVGPQIATDPAAQAALATIVNAASRAYKGGVHVQMIADPVLTTGWSSGSVASSTVTRYGGTIASELNGDRPTLVIGSPNAVVGNPVLHLTWDGWSAGVLQQADGRLGSVGNVMAGTLAAGLGISETFQRALGAAVPGRRDVGVSLWRPDLDWCSADAVGPRLEYLPAELWLLGLGHLGQAYAWILGMFPYAKPTDCDVGLMDFDTVVAGNLATQLLSTQDHIGIRKTRVVAAALERLGVRTRNVERAFDEQFHVVSHSDPNRHEPLVALAGFDDIAPRKLLGDAGFERVVDAGLGAGPVEYLDMVLHMFPAAVGPEHAFVEAPSREPVMSQAYKAEIVRQAANGIDQTAARCGMLEIANVTVGAAFVGTVAGTLAIADILRVLHDGQNYSIIALDLREPNRIKAITNADPATYIPRSTAAE